MRGAKWISGTRLLPGGSQRCLWLLRCCGLASPDVHVSIESITESVDYQDNPGELSIPRLSCLQVLAHGKRVTSVPC